MKRLCSVGILMLALIAPPSMAQLDETGAAAVAGTLDFSTPGSPPVLDGNADGAANALSASASKVDAFGSATAGVQLDPSALYVPVLTGSSVSSGQGFAAASAAIGVQGYTFLQGTSEQVDIELLFSGQMSPNPSTETIVLDPGVPLILELATELRAFAYLLDASASGALGEFAFPPPGVDPNAALSLFGLLQGGFYGTPLGSIDLTTRVTDPSTQTLLTLGAEDPVSGLSDVTGSATISVTLNPNDRVYLIAGLATQAIDGESALSLSTVRFAIDAPEGSLVPAATVVPLPSAATLLLGGLALLGFVRRRRAAARAG